MMDNKKEMKYMFSILIILAIVYIVYRLFRSRESYPMNSGMGSMFGGMILGYLLTNYLIDQNQYDMWRNLDDEQLRETLTSQGIVSDSDYDSLAEQATEGTLPGYDSQSDGTEWATNDSDNDFGGGDDFGGFDV